MKFILASRDASYLTKDKKKKKYRIEIMVGKNNGKLKEN